MGTPDVVEWRGGGVAWIVEAARAEVLIRELLPAVPGIAGQPGVELVKRSLQREVHRVRLSDGALAIVKAYRLRRWKDRVKRRLFGSKPRIEWGISRRLAALGVSASHAIAVGEPVGAPAGIEGYLVLDAQPDALVLTSYLAPILEPGGSLPAEPLGVLVRDLAGFVRGLHDRGVSHLDLHTGNILVRTAPPPGVERFLVVDLHRVRVGRTPRREHRVTAIAQLLQSFGAEIARDPGPTVSAFLDAYLDAGEPLQGGRIAPAQVIRAMRSRAARRLASRARRCLRESTGYTVETLSGWRIYHRRGMSAACLLALWEQHRQAASASLPECDSVESRFPQEGGGKVLTLRGYRARGWLGRALRGLVPCAAVRDYAAAHRAWLRQGTGPVAVAAAECRQGPDRGKSFAVFEIETDLR